MKTKLGISVGLFGAMLYLGAQMGGVLTGFLLLAYVMTIEENPWLKYTAIKAVVLNLAFAVIIAVIGYIPDAIDVIDDLATIFGSHFTIKFLTDLFRLLNNFIYFVKPIIFVLLAYKALKQDTIKIGFIDNLIEKHYLNKSETVSE